MKEITDYMIADADNYQDLQSKVRHLIGEGWTPTGGLAGSVWVLRGGSQEEALGICAQAMVKYQ
jgi:hypothetical protein